jgi:hypothetical protein
MKIAVAFVALVAIAFAVWLSMSTTTTADATGGLTVVELFQSQGCSSCPPANANVNAISDRPDVLALSFAVTYWDQLGWRDTFAKPQYTARQYAYAHGLRLGNVYTPQVVVNGRQDLTGIQRGQLDGAMAHQGRLPNHLIALNRYVLTIGAAAPQPPADVWLVRYDRRVLQVPITAGENNGVTLPHKNIVRELTHLGSWNGTAQTFRIAPSPDANFATAVLIETQNGGPILAAAKF